MAWGIRVQAALVPMYRARIAPYDFSYVVSRVVVEDDNFFGRTCLCGPVVDRLDKEVRDYR